MSSLAIGFVAGCAAILIIILIIIKKMANLDDDQEKETSDMKPENLD